MGRVDATWFATRKLEFLPADEGNYAITLSRSLLKPAAQFEVHLPTDDQFFNAGAVLLDKERRVRTLIVFRPEHDGDKLRWIGSFQERPISGQPEASPRVFLSADSPVLPARIIALGASSMLDPVAEDSHPPIDWVKSLDHGAPWEISFDGGVRIKLNESITGLRATLESRATSGRPYIAKALLLRNITRDFEIQTWQHSRSRIIDYLDGDEASMDGLDKASLHWARILIDWIEALEDEDRDIQVTQLRGDEPTTGFGDLGVLFRASDAIDRQHNNRSSIEKAIEASLRDVETAL